ncbi:hypothetical protein LMA00_06285 [Burkholderia ambifaria]|uniref:hypothetical protein n=1 Tax=Burkholderia ambifaria TaxID=152480 RepID=UPI001E464759|nr:hypothetical protein [Burkholderia ambifaria]UEP49357.1 hypothetical protein LMA00_06285 [Burkholderia ambifaria]
MDKDNSAHEEAAHVLAMVELINNGEELIDWDYWVGKMPRWTAYQAVRLMAALDPAKHDNLSFKRNETAGKAKEQAKRLETLAASHGMTEASPEAWLKWADDLSEPVHTGLRRAVERLSRNVSDRITVEDLAWMIAVQRADQTTRHSNGLDARDGLRRTIEIALQVRGWAPDGIPGVIPQIAELARAKRITLHGPVDTEAPDATDISACPAACWLTTDDAQRVLTSLCQSVRRYTIDDTADIIAMRVHPGDVEAQRGLRSSLVERMEYAIEQGELVANERRKDGEILLNEYSVDEWCAREQFPFRLSLPAQGNAEQAAMEASGRRTIEDIALALTKETGTEAARWESTLVAEIRGGALPLKNPRDLGDFLPYAVPKNLRTFYDRVDIADVNKLLDSRSDWRVTYRFPLEPLQALPKEGDNRFNDTGADGAEGAPGTKSVIGWRIAAEKQLDKLMAAHGGIYPGHKVALRWFKVNDAEAAFVPDDKDDEFTWVKADGKRVTSALKTFQNGMADILKSKQIPD